MNDLAPLVYDVGMNNGDDCAYYLAKGYRVIGIEANPILCDLVASRFSKQIQDKKLSIVNIGIGAGPGPLPFYVHKTNSVLSTFVPLGERQGYTSTLPAEQFDVITVDMRPLSVIIAFYGQPDYIKIDIEGFDSICLQDLSMNNIRPKYISAEAHDIRTFCHLVSMGYRQFKMVAGGVVSTDYASHSISLVGGGVAQFSFKPHSAGPFGDDIRGPWVGPETILDAWLKKGTGWFDLHATGCPMS